MKNTNKLGLATFGLVTLAGAGLITPVAFPALPAQATVAQEVQDGFNQAGGSENNTDLMSYVKSIINVMLFIVGVLSVIMIIFSGIRYVTAHGDKAQVESAKNTLIYSVVGLVIAIVAWAIVQFVFNLFS